MKNFLETILPGLKIAGIAWILFIVFEYFGAHPEYGQLLSLPLSPYRGLILLTILYLGYWLYRTGYEDKTKLELTLSPLRILGGVGVLTLFFGDVHLISFHSQIFPEVSFWKAQISVITKILSAFAFLLTLVGIAYGTGKRVLKLLSWEEEDSLQDALFSIGLGIGCIMLGMFGLGIVGGLKMAPVLLVLGSLVLLSFREIVEFGRLLVKKWKVEMSFFDLKIPFAVLLASLFALNLFDDLRPLPIGWDDMGVYLNMPKLMAGYGSLLPGSPNSYFLFATIPFVLGLGTMYGILTSFLGGILSILATLAFGKRFFKLEYGLLAAVIFYFMPMTMHQSFADMKTDMLLYFFSILSMAAFFVWHEKTKDLDLNNRSTMRWMILSGVFAGIAFGIKPNAIILIFSLVIALTYHFWGILGAIALLFAEWIIVIKAGYLNLGSTQLDPQTVWLLMGGLGVAILGLLVYLITHQSRKEKKVWKEIIVLLAFGASVLLPFSPWLIKNISEMKTPSLGAFITGTSQAYVEIDWKKAGIDEAQCKSSAKAEELDRYIGYDSGISKYLTLPWKMTMNTTVKGFYVDISFLFLALLPGLLWILPNRRTDDRWVLLSLMGIAMWTFWAGMGNGVIWYGIFGFLFLAMSVSTLSWKTEGWSRYLVFGIIFLSLLATFGNRSTKFGNGSTSQYAYGTKTANETIDAVVPKYRDISDVIDAAAASQKEPMKVYRIGTFIPFFLTKNDQRLFADAQLDVFSCLDTEKKNALTLKRLQDQGFRFVIFDTNTHTIERDPNGSLHQKVKRFIEFSNSSLTIHHYDPNKGIAFMEVPKAGISK